MVMMMFKKLQHSPGSIDAFLLDEGVNYGKSSPGGLF